MGHLRYGLILRSLLGASGRARFVSTWSVRCNNGFLNGSELTRNRPFKERLSDKCYVPDCCESFHFRRFSVALENDVHHVEAEAGLDDVKNISETITEEVETAEVQGKPKKERKEKEGETAVTPSQLHPLVLPKTGERGILGIIPK